MDERSSDCCKDHEEPRKAKDPCWCCVACVDDQKPAKWKVRQEILPQEAAGRLLALSVPSWRPLSSL